MLADGGQHNCPLRGSTQQTMEKDAETQILNGALGILWKTWGGGIKGLEGHRDSKERTTESTNLDL